MTTIGHSGADPIPQTGTDPIRNLVVSVMAHGWETLLSLAGILTIIGSFAAWATATVPLVGTISRSGTAGGDGWVSVVVGVVMIGLALASIVKGRLAGFGITAIVCALGLAAMAGFEWSDVSNKLGSAVRESDGLLVAGHGTGLFLLFVAAALALVSGGLLMARRYDGRVARSDDGRVDAPAVVTGPGWYMDPDGSNLHRYFDGSTWTDQFQLGNG